MNGLVSIIIPTYNRADFLGATLDSVLSQKYINWECIVIDDGSKDYTEELMLFYSKMDNRIKYFERPKSLPSGANSCRNFGYSLSIGDFVNWFDSDDLMHRDFLNEKVKSLVHSDAVCSICKFINFHYENGERIFEQKSKIGEINIVENIIVGNYSIPTNGPLWKKDYLKSKKLFNEKLTISQDLEFHLRTFPEDSRVKIIDQFLYYIRSGHSNITKDLYWNMSKHINSILFVRKEVLKRFKFNERVNNYVKNELMGLFRYLLARKDYYNSYRLLIFVRQSIKPANFKDLINYFKVFILFIAIRCIGKGETKLKRHLYL